MRSRDRRSVRVGAVLLVWAGLVPGTWAAQVAGPAVLASPAPSLKLTLSWSTASEVDNYGFLVLRGDLEEGPFKVMTPKVIPGAGTSDLPNQYHWEDVDVVSGRTYYYYLESVSLQGVKEKFSPVVSKTCCEPPAAQPSKAPATPEPKR
jgi:hypothetical protein